MDSAAKALGAEEVVAAIRAAAPEAEIIRTGTRGMIWLEPLVEVEIDGVRHGYGPATVGDVAGILDGSSAKALGPVKDLDWMKRQTRLTFARVGLIDPLDLADYAAHGGLIGLRRAIAMNGAEIVAEVTQSGLRGRGGAGFPTGIKWKTVHDADAPQKYIVCNADEGDSGTFADRMIMEGDPFTLIEGMAIAGLGVGATRGYVYLRSEYPDAIAVMRRAVEIARGAGVLGADVLGSGRAFDMEIRVGAGAYVCGEEARRGPRQAAASGAGRVPWTAHSRQQCHQPCHCAGDFREGRGALRRFRVGPVARHRHLANCRQCGARGAVRDGLWHHLG
jgi:formate dehydrogenase iron-sulfur subunit